MLERIISNVVVTKCILTGINGLIPTDNAWIVIPRGQQLLRLIFFNADLFFQYSAEKILLFP